MSEYTTQLHCGWSAYLAPEVVAVENGDGMRTLFCKPVGGFWTSTWKEAAHSSSWVDWCRSEREYGFIQDTHWFLLTPHADSKIYTIDTLDDLRRLVERYRLNLRDAFPGRGYGILRDHYVDYMRASQEYDAIHLTEAGQWRTRLTIPNLYGWDCECTLWFRWCFANVQEVVPAVESPAEPRS